MVRGGDLVEIAVAWATLPETPVQVTRKELVKWAHELDLPSQAVPKTSTDVLGSFVNLARATEHRYEGADGPREVVMTATGRETPAYLVRTLESRRVGAEQPAARKVGQVKLFLPRRNTLGPVPDAHGVQLAGTTRDPIDQDAARAWFTEFKDRYTRHEMGVPLVTVRALVRDTLELHGIPVRRRMNTYFLYPEALPVTGRLQALFDRIGTGGEVFYVRMREDPRELAIMAEAVEIELVHRLTLLENLIAVRRPDGSGRGGLTNHQRWNAEAGLLGQLLERHEVRLGLRLPAARHLLETVEDKLRLLDPTRRLPKVRGQ